MKFKKSYLLIISLISILCISAVSANDISADTVSDNSDSDLTAITNNVDTKTTSDNSDSDLVKANEVTKDNNKKLSVEDTDELKDSTPEKINTTTESKNKDVMYNKSVELDVNVKDNASKALTNLNKTDFDVSDVTNGDEPLDFNYNNSIINITTILNSGLHNIKIKFIGNTTYNASETIVNVNVFANTIITNSTVAVNNYTKTVNIPIIVKDYNETVLTTYKDDFKLNLTYFDGTENKTIPITNFDLVNNIIKFVTSDLNQSEVTIYYKNGIQSNFTKPVVVKLDLVELVNTTIESKNKEIIYNNTLGLDVSVKTNGSKIVNGLTKDDFFVTEGENSLNFTYKNSIINIMDILNPGLHNIKIKYLGNVSYNASETIVNVTVFANTIKVPESVNVNNHTMNVTISVTVQDYNGTNLTLNINDFKLNQTYFNGTANKTEPITVFELINGTLNFKVNVLNQTKVTIYYGDDSNYTKPVDVLLNPYIDLKVIPVNVSVDYQSGEFKFQIVDNDDGTVVANKTIDVSLPGNVYFAETTSTGGTSISSSKSFTTDSEGFIIIKNSGISSNLMDAASGIVILDAGKYNLTLKSSAAGLSLNTKQEITVNKAKANIVLDNYVGYVGDDIILKYKVTNTNGEVIKYVKLKTQFDGLTVSGENYYNLTTNSTGDWFTKNLGSKLPANTYSFVVSSVDPNIDAEAITRTMTVNKKEAVISANNMVVPYNTGLPLSFTLKDAKTGKAIPNTVITLSIYTGSKHADYTATTDANGQVKINFLTILSLGKHKLVIGISDSTYTANSITRYATIKKASAKFTAPKLKTYYNSGKIFKIKVTTGKKAIYNAKVNVRLYISKNKYYKLSGKTGATGLLKINLAKLKPGTYKVVISSTDKGFTAKSINSQIKITKAKVKISPNKFRAKSGKKLKIKVTGKYNKKAVKGLKLKVKISKGKTSKTYTVKSNKKGFAYLKIKQNPGKYKVAISPSSACYTAKNTKTTIVVKK